jgi:tRNA pseudouridine55 synthase
MPREEAQTLLMPLDSLFRHHPAVTLNAKQERLCRNGLAFQSDLPDGTYRVYGADGAFLMLGEILDGTANAIKRFF